MGRGFKIGDATMQYLDQNLQIGETKEKLKEDKKEKNFTRWLEISNKLLDAWQDVGYWTYVRFQSKTKYEKRKLPLFPE